MHEKNKLGRLVFIILVVIILVVPATGLFVENNSTQEKRELNEFPNLELDSNVNDFPEKFDAYFNDRFLFRNALITANNYYYLQVFRVSGKPDKVAVGKNNWLFYSEGDIIDYQRGTELFKEEELSKITSDLEERERLLNERGIKYYLTIAPNKHSIYYENLPQSLQQKGSTDRYEQLMTWLRANSEFAIVDLEKPLLNAKEYEQTYFKYNTHWSSYGALIGYQTVINEISNDFKNIKPLGESDFKVEYVEIESSDLKSMLSLDNKIFESINQYSLNSNIAKKEVVEGSKYRMTVYHTNNENLPNAILLGDSFTGYGFATFLAQHFNYLVLMRESTVFYPLTEEILSEYDPDLVIQEFVERKLYSIDTSPLTIVGD